VDALNLAKALQAAAVWSLVLGCSTEDATRIDGALSVAETAASANLAEVQQALSFNSLPRCVFSKEGAVY
jgi:hypothetical protein